MRSIKQELRALPLFAETSRQELTLIGQLLTRLTLPAGKTLVREGARGNEFMIIVEGTAAGRSTDRHHRARRIGR